MSPKKNPFEQVVEFIGVDYVPVTLELLQQVGEFYISGGIKLETFGEIFESLKFLEQHGVISLTHNPETNQFLVKSIYGNQ